MEALDRVRYRDLTPEQQELSDLLGMDTFLRLVRLCGGTSLYIPKSESVGRAARDAMIRAEFTGSNYKELAAKYRLSDVWIRSIVTKTDH